VQVSCAVRSYWQRSPSILSDYKHSQQSYFLGLYVDSVSITCKSVVAEVCTVPVLLVGAVIDVTVNIVL